MRAAAPLAAGLAALGGAAGAQDANPARAGLLLQLPTSARALGLGQAAAAAAPDEWLVFFAPSRLAGVRRFGAGVATEAYLVGTRLSAMASAFPIGAGTVGLGATVLDYGSVPEVVAAVPGADGSETGRRWSAADQAFSVAYGARVTPTVGAGIGLEFVHSRVADLSASAAAVSASVDWEPRAGWPIVASAQHIGSDVRLGATNGRLPATIRVAAGAPPLRLAALALHPVLEWNTVRGAGPSWVIATEAIWRASSEAAVMMRGAFAARPASADRDPATVGVGVALGSIGLDYSFERFPTIGQVTHRIGVRVVRRPRP